MVVCSRILSGITCWYRKCPPTMLRYTIMVSDTNNFNGLSSFKTNRISINFIIKNKTEINPAITKMFSIIYTAIYFRQCIQTNYYEITSMSSISKSGIMSKSGSFISNMSNSFNCTSSPVIWILLESSSNFLSFCKVSKY